MVGYNHNTEIIPYEVLEADGAHELRYYERLVLISTPMQRGLDEQSSPFYRLFHYISGKNAAAQEIPMTAPVFMDQENDQTTTMEFVMPADMLPADTPAPQDPLVDVKTLEDYTVAAIRFSGLLEQDNIAEHRQKLELWIAEKGWVINGPVKAAGYNPPFTIPALRRNEVLIPVERL